MVAVTAVAEATGLDQRSLFELDDRLMELMAQVEQAAEAGEAISQELAQAIDAYLEAHRHKVDRVAGYWRWQQSIADICGREAERMSARKRAAENRIVRLKGYVQAFMVSRGVRKLEGERSDISMQRNSSASVVIDDPSRLPEHFLERAIRFTKPELRELIAALPDGALSRRLAFTPGSDGWVTNGESIRAGLMNGELIEGVRLLTGSHLRLR